MTDKISINVAELVIDGRVIENPTEMQITIEKEEYKLPYLGGKGGGNYASNERITSIGCEGVIHDLSATTISELFSGTLIDVAAGSVVDEAMILRQGLLVPTAFPIDVDTAPTITENVTGTHATSTVFAENAYIKDGTHLYRNIAPGGGTTDTVAPTFPTDGSTVVDGTVTWKDEGEFAAVLDTDFIAKPLGIQAVSGSGIPDYCPAKVSYTKHPAGRVELGGATNVYRTIAFNGWNDEDNTPVIGQLYKGKLSANGGIPLISSGYADIPFKVEALVDTSKSTTGGASRFGYLTVGDQKVV